MSVVLIKHYPGALVTDPNPDTGFYDHNIQKVPSPAGYRPVATGWTFEPAEGGSGDHIGLSILVNVADYHRASSPSDFDWSFLTGRSDQPGTLHLYVTYVLTALVEVDYTGFGL